MRYHRIAIWALAFGFVGGAAIAQPRTWTQPVVPNRAWLDRLNLDLGWKVSVPMDGQRDGIATIQSIGGQVIVQTARGRIVCIDGDSGGIRWMATVGEPYSVTHEVGFNDDVVLVANTTRIYALDRADGIVRWDIDLPGTPSSPPAANALAFFVNLSNGRLSSYVLPNAQLYLQGQRPAGPAKGPADVKTPTKTTVPSNDPRAAVAAAATGTARTVTVSAAVDNRSATGAVQTGGGRTAVGGVDIKKTFSSTTSVTAPQLFWDFQTTKRVNERPAIGSRSVLVVSSENTAFLIDQLDVTRVTELKTAAPISAPIGQYGETAYVADRDGDLYAVDLQQRAFLWRYTVNGAIAAMPQATDEDLFIVADRAGLIRMDRQVGTSIWQNPEATQYLATNPKFVYATDKQGRLLVLDRRRGIRLATLDTSEFVFHVQNETTDRILLAAHDGTVICLHDKAFAKSLAIQSEGAKVAAPLQEAPKPAPKPEKPLPGKGPEKPADKAPDKTDKPATPMPTSTTPPNPMPPKGT